MYWWQKKGGRLLWGQLEKHFWNVQMKCRRSPRKANLTLAKPHTSVSKCALLLWNPPLSPPPLLSVFLHDPLFFTLTHFSLNIGLLCEGIECKMWLTAHHTGPKNVRVSAKIHILPLPVTLMKSSISRFFFSSCLPSNPSAKSAAEMFSSATALSCIHNPVQMFWSIRETRFSRCFVETYCVKATQSKFNRVFIQRHTNKRPTSKNSKSPEVPFSRQGIG